MKQEVVMEINGKLCKFVNDFNSEYQKAKKGNE